MRTAWRLASLCALACLLASATDQVCNSPDGCQATPAPDDDTEARDDDTGDKSSLIALRRTRGQPTLAGDNLVLYTPQFPRRFKEGGSTSDCLSEIPKNASDKDLYEMTFGCQLLAESYLLQGIVHYQQLLSSGVAGQMKLDKLSEIFNDSARYRLVHDSCYEVAVVQEVQTQEISATSESSYETTLSKSMGVSVSAGAGFAGFQVSSSYESNSASSSATVGQQYSSSVQKLYQYSVAHITNTCLTPSKAGTYITKSTQDAWTNLINACELFVPVVTSSYTSCDWAQANAKVMTAPPGLSFGTSTTYWTMGVEMASLCGHVNCYGAGWEDSGSGWKCPSNHCWDQGLWCVSPEELGWDPAANGVAETEVSSYMTGTGPRGFMLPTESTFGSRYMYDLTSSYTYTSEKSSQSASKALSAAMAVSYDGATASTSYEQKMKTAFSTASSDTEQTLAITMDENNNIQMTSNQTYDDMVAALQKSAQEWMKDPTMWTAPGISSTIPLDSVLEVDEDKLAAAQNAVTSLTWFAGLQPATPSCIQLLSAYSECLLTKIATVVRGCNSYYAGAEGFWDMGPTTGSTEWTCCCHP